jgi:hypothetical protein
MSEREDHGISEGGEKELAKVVGIVAGLGVWLKDAMKRGASRQEMVQVLVEKGVSSTDAEELVGRLYSAAKKWADAERVSVPMVAWAVFVGGILAVLGALFWGYVAVETGQERGLLAFLLGGVVGYGVALATRKLDWVTRVVAVMSALGALIGGKVVTITLLVKRSDDPMYQIVLSALPFWGKVKLYGEIMWKSATLYDVLWVGILVLMVFLGFRHLQRIYIRDLLHASVSGKW